MARKSNSKNSFHGSWLSRRFPRLFGGRGGLRDWCRIIQRRIQILLWLSFVRPVLVLRQTLGVWWSRRDFRYLLRGLPALLVGLLTVYLACILVVTPAQTRADNYRSAAETATKSESHNAARIYYQRAIELNGGSDAMRFALAQAAQKTGDYPRMAAILQQLAPDEGLGFAPAHLWVASSLLSKSNPTAEQIRRAELQLRKVIELHPNNPNGRILLGEVYYNLGMWENAIEQLDVVRRTVPEKNLMIAKSHARLGDARTARRYGIAALEHFQELVQRDPTSLPDLLLLAEATMFIEEYGQSINLLKNAIALNNDEAAEKRINEAITRTFVAWSDSVAGEDRASRERGFQLLCAALDYNPDEPLLLERLMEFVSPHSVMENEAKEYLLDSIVGGRAVGASHLLLAIHSFSVGEDVDQAKFHLERAIKLLPNAPIVANNLAWILANAEPHELERALKVMNPLIEQFPDAERFRDTRGHILARMERWQEAIDDLERCLPAMNKNLATHRDLALAYRAVGAAA
ncbi:MAG: tetratricopeptide (TPR) repeat protein, partial [Pirellulaceae bacterium]